MGQVRPPYPQSSRALRLLSSATLWSPDRRSSCFSRKLLSDDKHHIMTSCLTGRGGVREEEEEKTGRKEEEKEEGESGEVGGSCT